MLIHFDTFKKVYANYGETFDSPPFIFCIIQCTAILVIFHESKEKEAVLFWYTYGLVILFIFSTSSSASFAAAQYFI